MQASAPAAAPAETSAPPESAPAAVEVSEPAAKVEPVEPAKALSPPPSSDKPQDVAAGGGNQERVRIDPMSGRIMSAPAARSGRVPPGGYSSGPLWWLSQGSTYRSVLAPRFISFISLLYFCIYLPTYSCKCFCEVDSPNRYLAQLINHMSDNDFLRNLKF